MGKLSEAKRRMAPYALVAGLVMCVFLSWRTQSVSLATVAGALVSISFLPFPSGTGGAKAGALIGGIAGALAEGILNSPDRGVERIFFASGYGVLFGCLWGFLVGRFLQHG